jgi:hypothetical protein
LYAALTSLFNGSDRTGYFSGRLGAKVEAFSLLYVPYLMGLNYLSRRAIRAQELLVEAKRAVEEAERIAYGTPQMADKPSDEGKSGGDEHVSGC